MAMSDYLRNLRAKIGNDMIVMPAAAAVVINDDGEVLLLRRSDDGEWATPAGIIEPGHFRFLAVGEEILNLEEVAGAKTTTVGGST